MEYVICGLCCILFFFFGLLTGEQLKEKVREEETDYQTPDDLLSHDIMSLLSYAVPQRKEENDEQTD
ncbi:MAG: hypothetical protein ACI4PQ_03000 [Butyricicoccaceae bacterium]